LADLLYYKSKEVLFLLIAKAFWNHQHCWWFSGYKKNPTIF